MTGTRAAAVRESPRARGLLIAAALAFLTLFVAVPLAAVGIEALSGGLALYARAVTDPDALAALRLSLLAAALAVSVNTAAGVTAAWALTRPRVRGRAFLLTLVDVPLAVSPVVAGLFVLLLYGKRGWFGGWLAAHGLPVVFAVPGIVLATVFVTFPYVAREVVPVLQAAGLEQEEAARVLGASRWQTFWRVTLPAAKWGVLHGVVLCSARSLGEFGAVSVVSGHIRGLTNTLPLHVQALYDEYQTEAAFAVATLLAFFSLLTLAAKTAIERRERSETEPAAVAREEVA